jgi:hypothetical protein
MRSPSRRSRPYRFWIPVVCLLALPAPGVAALVGFEVEGNSVLGRVEFPPNLAVDVTLEFEDALGLTLDSLGISARLVNGLELAGRLPQGVSLPGALPVLLRVEPPAAGPLTFAGVYTLEVHTHNLPYLPNSPLRLFKAPLGGAFTDMTASMGAGSYRARGTSGDFSDFLILADIRPLTSVAQSKFDAVEDLLADHWQELPAELGDALVTELDEAWSDYAAGAYAAASQSMAEFEGLVRDHASEIPSVWRASRDLVNVGGDLRAAASTLQFTLNLLASQLP